MKNDITQNFKIGDIVMVTSPDYLSRINNMRYSRGKLLHIAKNMAFMR